MKRFQPAPSEIDELPPVDVILISHSHYDHLEKDSVQALNSKGNSHFIVSLGMGVLLKKWGVPQERITELDWWQSTERNGIRYTALPARHDSSRTLTDHNQALWSSFAIEHGSEKFYFHGDSAQGSHFDKIAEKIQRV
jgi:multidrug resistance protein romA